MTSTATARGRRRRRGLIADDQAPSLRPSAARHTRPPSVARRHRRRVVVDRDAISPPPAALHLPASHPPPSPSLRPLPRAAIHNRGGLNQPTSPAGPLAFALSTYYIIF